MGLRRLLVRMLDPVGGNPGDVATINPAGTKATWAAPTTGGAATLADLTDVDESTPPADGQTLTFDGTASVWKPGNPVDSVVPGDGILVDNSDPANPVISVAAVALVPLTTVIGGVPDFVWDADNQLVTTEAP